MYKFFVKQYQWNHLTFHVFNRTPSIRLTRRPKQSDTISESTGDLNLPTNPLQSSSSHVNADETVELEKFETQHFPEVPVHAEDSGVFESTPDETDAKAESNNVVHHGNDRTKSKKITQQDSKQSEVEYYGIKMFIFVLFILALIMIPIAIVWETRKTYFRSTLVFKSFSRWVFRSFGVRL